jgi:hypothetical protein
MSSGVELDPTDYHLRLMIERMQREGTSEAAIGEAVRIASGEATGQDDRAPTVRSFSPR